jgi:peptide/nickel transport system ATP-binding protein
MSANDATSQRASPLLEVEGLGVSLVTDGGRLEAVRDVSLRVDHRSVVALVGESGSGKTITAHAILRILPPGAHIERGTIRLDGQDLVTASERELVKVRGGRVGMVFQEPMTSLNPVYTVGAQIVEAIRLHHDVSRGEARRRGIEWLAKVGMPEPERRFGSYPHELSGGMRQRVLIAMALAPGPRLLIADEPTTALDRSVEAQILALVDDLVREDERSMLFISHDFALVSQTADRILVMYAGQIVEEGGAGDVLTSPQHPYTQALIEGAHDLLAPVYRERGKKRRPLPVIEGTAPDLRRPTEGCRFAPRCPKRMGHCERTAPPLYTRGAISVRCFLFEAAPPTSSRRALVLDDEPQPTLALEDEA